jgi:hypothetical protein
MPVKRGCERDEAPDQRLLGERIIGRLGACGIGASTTLAPGDQR